MERKNAKKVIAYCHGIPEMKKLLLREKQELEDKYNAVGAARMGGMPHGQIAGNQTGELAIKLAENGTGNRIKQIERQIAVLDRDYRAIREVLDGLCGNYKKLLLMRYQHGYSWGKISAKTGIPDSTVRHWHDRALDRFAEAFFKTKKAWEILKRASRARA